MSLDKKCRDHNPPGLAEPYPSQTFQSVIAVLDMIFGSPLHLNGVVAGFIDLLLAKWTNHRSGLTWLGCVRPIAAREYAWPDKWWLALGFLLCGGAGRVGRLFRGCRAAGAAGCADIPVLDHDVLLVRS